MAQKYLQGLCDLSDALSILGAHEPTVSWNEEACNQFKEKHKQVIDGNMPPYCLKVCGNCEYFTVGEFEIYANPSSEPLSIGRIK